MPNNKLPQDRLEKINEANGYKYTTEVKQKALAMHLHLCTVKEISNALGIEEKVIKEWVGSKNWVTEKRKVIKQLFGNLYSRRKDNVENIIGLGLGIMERALADIHASGQPLTVSDLQRMMSILSDANKMLRLEEGKPTDIMAKLDFKTAKKKIKELIDSDPFGEFDAEAEIVELDEEGNPIQH